MLRDKRGLNKKAQGLSTNAIILIILGVIILAVLVIGFTVGWNTLFPFLERNNNVDQVVQSCTLACTTGSSYDFCSRDRVIKISGQEDVTGACIEFAPNGVKYNADYKVKACPEISCPSS